MHIAFLTPEYPHVKTGTAGGIGTSIKNLAESLVALGHTVRILVYGQKGILFLKKMELSFSKLKMSK